MLLLVQHFATFFQTPLSHKVLFKGLTIMSIFICSVSLIILLSTELLQNNFNFIAVKTRM